MAHMTGIIRIANPTKIGPALGDLRAINGFSRRRLARLIAAQTGRSETSVNSQLWGWDNEIHQPDLASIPIVLDALGYDLALIPREDAP